MINASLDKAPAPFANFDAMIAQISDKWIKYCLTELTAAFGRLEEFQITPRIPVLA
ncbi:MAG: hypothetical protein OXC72_11100 [Roseovarius sp.]|nr:hypothetical protein [Roseovarius sp.]MCY4292288.1 hypothetical protein [Roseovarius sp.]